MKKQNEAMTKLISGMVEHLENKRDNSSDGIDFVESEFIKQANQILKSN